MGVSGSGGLKQRWLKAMSWGGSGPQEGEGSPRGGTLGECEQGREASPRRSLGRSLSWSRRSTSCSSISSQDSEVNEASSARGRSDGGSPHDQHKQEEGAGACSPRSSTGHRSLGRSLSWRRRRSSGASLEATNEPGIGSAEAAPAAASTVPASPAVVFMPDDDVTEATVQAQIQEPSSSPLHVHHTPWGSGSDP